MASWLPGGGGGKGPPGGRPPNPSKPKKKERWLVTRKTWRYMADAGKLLIPEALRKGKDYRDYTEEDLRLLEEHYQNVCEQQREFIIWEGPVEDPRVALAKNRKAPSLSTDAEESESHDSSDFRFESHSAKFRIVLPSGQAPPPGYLQVGSRQLPVGGEQYPEYHRAYQDRPESYRRLPSGLLVQELPCQLLQDPDWSYDSSLASPLESGIYSPSTCGFSRECSPDIDNDNRESGIGSGAEYYTKRSMSIQTDPLPAEFFALQEEEHRLEEERRRREEEENRLAIAEESEALARKEARRNSVDGDAMGDTVMRYLKMVRRNSKTADHKKAERFRSMNYDPTLRNIKSKYVAVEEGCMARYKHVSIQCGESLIRLLKQCETPIEPAKPKRRRVSQTPSETISESFSPRYSITITDDTIPHEVERDFFTHLYGGDIGGLDSGNIPEEYYSYLEAWYRSQIGAQLADMQRQTSGSAPSLHSNLFQKFDSSSGPPPAPPAAPPTTTAAGPTGPSHTCYIPVTALQSLRTSLPAHLPQLSTGKASF